MDSVKKAPTGTQPAARPFGDEVTLRLSNTWETSKILVVRVYSVAMATICYVASTVTFNQATWLEEWRVDYWWEANNFGDSLRGRAWGIVNPTWAEEIIDGKTPAEKPKKDNKVEDKPKPEEAPKPEEEVQEAKKQLVEAQKALEETKKAAEEAKKSAAEAAKASKGPSAVTTAAKAAGSWVKDSVKGVWGAKGEMVARAKLRGKFVRQVGEAQKEIVASLTGLTRGSEKIPGIPANALSNFEKSAKNKWDLIAATIEENFNFAADENHPSTWTNEKWVDLVKENKAEYIKSLRVETDAFLERAHLAATAKALEDIWAIKWNRTAITALTAKEQQVQNLTRIFLEKNIAALQQPLNNALVAEVQQAQQSKEAAEQELNTLRPKCVAKAPSEKLKNWWRGQVGLEDFTKLDGSYLDKRALVVNYYQDWQKTAQIIAQNQVPVVFFAQQVNQLDGFARDILAAPADNADAQDAVIPAPVVPELSAAVALAGLTVGSVSKLFKGLAKVIGFNPWAWVKGSCEDVVTLAKESRTGFSRGVAGIGRATVLSAISLTAIDSFFGGIKYLTACPEVAEAAAGEQICSPSLLNLAASVGNSWIADGWFSFAEECLVIGALARGNFKLLGTYGVIRGISFLSSGTLDSIFNFANNYAPPALYGLVNAGIGVVSTGASLVGRAAYYSAYDMNVYAQYAIFGTISVGVGAAVAYRVTQLMFGYAKETLGSKVPWFLAKPAKWLWTGRTA